MALRARKVSGAFEKRATVSFGKLGDLQANRSTAIGLVKFIENLQ